MRIRTITVALATLLVAAACISGCSSRTSDDALATNIKAQMFSDPQVKSANLVVTVSDGEATLSGDVPDATARDRAFRLASDTPGVKHVVDAMTVLSAVAPSAAPSTPTPPAAPQDPAPAPKPSQSHRQSVDVAQTDVPAPDPVVTPPQLAPPPPQEQAPAAAPVEPPPPPPAEPAPPPPPQPKHVEIPSGTPVHIQMIDSVDSTVNKAGETFHASLAAPITIQNDVVVPTGTDVWVRLINAQASGQFSGQSRMSLELARMEYQGQSYALVSNTYQQTGTNRSTRTAETVGGGAVLGAVLGGLIGHGKGAVIGAAGGAGAGTAAQAATKPQQIKIASEAKLDFSLQQPLDVSYFPDKNAAPQH